MSLFNRRTKFIDDDGNDEALQPMLERFPTWWYVFCVS